MSGLFVIHHLTPIPSHSGLYNRQIHARRFRERVTAEGLSTEAQDGYLGHFPALPGIGSGFFTRSGDETYLDFGIDPPFGLESQKMSGGFRVTRGRGSPAADILAPVFPVCLGTNEKRRRVAPKLACLRRQLFSFCSCPCSQASAACFRHDLGLQRDQRLEPSLPNCVRHFGFRPGSRRSKSTHHRRAGRTGTA